MTDQLHDHAADRLAGTTTACLDLGVVAEFDLLTGEFIHAALLLPHLTETAQQVVNKLRDDDVSQDAARRLSLLDTCQSEEPWHEHLFDLDRLAASLTIEERVSVYPQLDAEDPMLIAVLDNFADGAYVKTNDNGAAFASITALIERKTNRAAEAPFVRGRDRAHLGAHLPPIASEEVPMRYQLLTPMVHLAEEGQPIATWETGTLRIAFQITAEAALPEHWANRVVGLLLDEDDPLHEVIGICLPTVDTANRSLTFGFVLSKKPTESMVFAIAERQMVDADTGQITTLTMADFRRRLDADVAVFAAVRLAQKGALARARTVLESAIQRARQTERNWLEEVAGHIADVRPSGLVADM